MIRELWGSFGISAGTTHILGCARQLQQTPTHPSRMKGRGIQLWLVMSSPAPSLGLGFRGFRVRGLGIQNFPLNSGPYIQILE